MRVHAIEDYTEPPISSRVPAHIALRDCARDQAKCRGSGPMVQMRTNPPSISELAAASVVAFVLSYFIEWFPVRAPTPESI